MDRFKRAYQRVEAFSVLDLFSRKHEPGPKRTVHVNEPLPEEYYDFNKKGERKRVNKDHVYINNQVITSKYTVLTFVPRNLLEQFRRVANVFFLAIAILQFFNKFSTISPGLVILPLLVIIAITAAKDGYEDIKRHQSDQRVNSTAVRVLSGGSFENHNVTKAKTRTFVRGILPQGIKRKSKKKRDKDPEKAEAKRLAEEAALQAHMEFDSDDEDGTAPQSARGDETHHFWQHTAPQLPHWRHVRWEDVKVGDFVKILEDEPIPADLLICATSEEENEAFVETKNLDGETNLKSRIAVPSLTHLRSARACADNANQFSVDCDTPDVNMFKLNTSVRQNGNDGKSERTSADIQMTLFRGTVLRNTRWVVGLVLFTGEDTKIVMNSGGTPSKRSKVERQMNPQVFINLAILAIFAVVLAIADSSLEKHYYPLGAPWLYGDSQGDDNPSINGLVTWAFALITFQNIVPISLYISIEFVRTCQAAFIYFDYDMWYSKTNQATLARSWNLSDDLGQIEYIFSDKTGTLTQNAMVFQKCSVGGKIYDSEVDSSDPQTLVGDRDMGQVSSPPNPVFPEGAAKAPSGLIADPEKGLTGTRAPSPKPGSNIGDDTSSLPSSHQGPPSGPKSFYNKALESDIADSLHISDPSSSNAAHARMLNGFFTVLSLCHTVLTSVDPQTGRIQYKAQSPDEAALVQAAADVGYRFKGKDRDVLTLEKPGADGYSVEERYELLNILEFNSTRKRMSVVLRRLDEDDARIFLLTKGADNVIFERLRPDVDDELKEMTDAQLGEFASEGLRTLTLAYKVIPDDEYDAWSERYHAATVTMENRESLVDTVSAELETDLRLLGATAIEDSLQDGVPDTIDDLKRAGIKIWVATGDKLETAIAIGHSTKLVANDSNVIIIRGTSKPVQQQMINAIEQFFPDSGLLDGPDAPDFGNDESSYQGRPSLQHTLTGVSSIVGADNGERPGGFVLVIDGEALGAALANEKYRQLLLKLAVLCEGVICCRVSPLQKALVVKLVKDGLGVMTLAIGDGANDVSMIQAADVGVGISGEEGLQAVNSSDYAIAQFRFLKRLLLVHGHWSYARNGNMICNFFYKNIVCIGVLWWFQIYCGWSSTYFFEYTYLLWWNAFFTIAPVIAMGIFDRLTDAEVLMALPELYRFGREGHWFGLTWFSIYMFDGLVQSTVIFFLVTYGAFSPTSRPDGYAQSLLEFSTTAVISAVMVANLVNGLNTNVWTGWVFFAVFLGIVIVWVYSPIYNAIKPGWFSTPVYGNNVYLFHSALFWLSLPIAILLPILPRYIAKAYKFGYAPDDIDIVRWIRKVDPTRDLRDPTGLAAIKAKRAGPAAESSESIASSRQLPSRPGAEPMRSFVSSRTDMSTGLRSAHRGFDFVTEENGVAMRRMQTNLSERRSNSRADDHDRHEKRHHRLGSAHFKSLLRRKPRTPPSS